MLKCEFFNIECIYNPSGIVYNCNENNCFHLLEVFKYFEIRLGAELEDEDKDLVLDSLEKELNSLEIKYPIDKRFLKVCFKQVIKYYYSNYDLIKIK